MKEWPDGFGVICVILIGVFSILFLWMILRKPK